MKIKIHWKIIKTINKIIIETITMIKFILSTIDKAKKMLEKSAFAKVLLLSWNKSRHCIKAFQPTFNKWCNSDTLVKIDLPLNILPDTFFEMIANILIIKVAATK